MRWIAMALALMCAALLLFLISGNDDDDRADVAQPSAERAHAHRAPHDPPEPAEARAAATSPDSAPIKTGSCALEITLVDVETGRPIKSDVHLYRLGIPANAHWTAGDHLHARVSIPVKGGRIDNLPPGRYRLDCGAQRVTGTADRDFDVRGKLTRHIGHVQAARSDALWLHVTTPDGKPLGLQSVRWSRGQSWRWNAPWWANLRSSVTGDRSIHVNGSGGRVSARSIGTRYVDHRGPVRIGVVLEESRRKVTAWGPATWGCKDRSRVYLPILVWRGKPLYLRGISVPLAPIHDAVLLPNGSRAFDHGAQIVASSNAVEGTGHDVRREPIHVRVTLADFSDLSFEFLPGAPVPVHRMQAK